MHKTSLYKAHESQGAKLVEFAGYSMPVQYNEGILKEHLHVREKAGLFDVSHMGQGYLEGSGAIELIEKLTPSNFKDLPQFSAKYTVLTNKNGGIIDDLIITKLADDKFFFVYNAGTKKKDEAWIKSHLSLTTKFTPLTDRSLIALQGPKAEEALTKLFVGQEFATQKYMTFKQAYKNEYGDVFVSRLGYTGEDGFEISVENAYAERLWNDLSADPDVKSIGLGARDSLRLEMGYPLYGHDIDDETTPIEASLGWIMPKDKRDSFGLPKRTRVGFEVEERSIIREGVEVFDETGNKIGKVTSGGFSPSLNKPIAQGYINPAFSAIGTKVNFELRGRKIAGKVAPVNFLKPRTKTAK